MGTNNQRRRLSDLSDYDIFIVVAALGERANVKTVVTRADDCGQAYDLAAVIMAERDRVRGIESGLLPVHC